MARRKARALGVLPPGFQQALLAQAHEHWIERARFEAGLLGKVVAVAPSLRPVEEGRQDGASLAGAVRFARTCHILNICRLYVKGELSTSMKRRCGPFSPVRVSRTHEALAGVPGRAIRHARTRNGFPSQSNVARHAHSCCRGLVWLRQVRRRVGGFLGTPEFELAYRPRQMGQCQVACDRQYPGRQATELWVELAGISPRPQKRVLRDILRSRSVEPHPTQICEYPALVRLDDAAKGRVITTSGLADIRVKFQGAAPDLPHILAAAGKVTG